MTDEKKDFPSPFNADGERTKGVGAVDPKPAPLFDVERLLRAADAAARFGLSPADLLAEAVRAEGRLPETESSLASLVENNDPSRMVDVFESPTFRRRLRELRVWARTVGVGPDAYVVLPEDLKGGTRTSRTDLDQLGRALKELRAIGRALSLCGPNPPERRKVLFEEMVLLRNEDGSCLLDDEGLPAIVTQEQALERGPGQWQPISAIERNLEAFTRWIREAMRRTKGMRQRSEIRAALEQGNVLIPPPFREEVADIVTKQRQRFPRMRAESVALCWAYRVEVNPSVADALRERSNERRKKRRKRGGHSVGRNVP
jgi:hypothetical protein